MAVRIFFCYAHEDEFLLDQLKSHLKPLQQQGLIEMWYDRDIRAGAAWKQEIAEQLERAHVILLLLSANFMNSEYCYGDELMRALERHTRGEVQLIPIVLRPVFWQNGPLGKLQALPTDGKPVISTHWSHLDEAFLTVVEGIYNIVRERYLGAGEPIETVNQQRDQISAPVSVASVQQISAKYSAIDENEDFALLHVLPGHVLYVSSIVISSDGKTLVSGGGDGRVKLWDLASRRLLHTFECHEGGVSSIAISHDGQTIASGGRDGTVKTWNTRSRKLSHIFEHPEESMTVSMSSNGQMLASGGSDGRIKLWNLNSGRVLRTFEGHEGGVSSIAIGSNGQTLASGGSDGRIKLWNLNSGKIVRAPKGHEHFVYSIVMSPNGGLLASCGDDEKVKLWNIASGQLVRTLEQATDSIYSITMSPDGQTLVSGAQDGIVKLWDMSTGELLSTLEGQAAVLTIAMGSHGQCIIIGDDNGRIQIWGKSTRRS